MKQLVSFPNVVKYSCSVLPTPTSLLASVDYETDRKIQDTIAYEFEDRTILCIARKPINKCFLRKILPCSPFFDVLWIRSSTYYYFLWPDMCSWCRSNCSEFLLDLVHKIANSVLFQEFDTPASLFALSDGIFRGMCEQSGITLGDIKLAAIAKKGW